MIRIFAGRRARGAFCVRAVQCVYACISKFEPCFSLASLACPLPFSLSATGPGYGISICTLFALSLSSPFPPSLQHTPVLPFTITLHTQFRSSLHTAAASQPLHVCSKFPAREIKEEIRSPRPPPPPRVCFCQTPKLYMKCLCRKSAAEEEDSEVHAAAVETPHPIALSSPSPLNDGGKAASS